MVPFKKERKELIKVGRIAFEGGLTDTHGGNISMRVGRHILIKKSGKMLGFLNDKDFVITTLDANPKSDRFASIELKVHRSIYRELPEVNSILHTHSPYTVACSLKFEKIIPMDSEGKLLLGEVPILRAETVVSSDEVAEELPKLLKKSPVAVVYSHGPFAVGHTPEEALMYISALENSCKILINYHSLRS